MANQEISLKWNGYQNNILLNVKELFKDEGLSDVTLVSEGHCFKAHKVILSANSSVFRTIFQQNPHKDPIIVLHDISTVSLRTLLTFMYNGEVNVTEEFLPVLLKTAETLRICGLSTSSEVSRDDDKATGSALPKKRKKSEQDDCTGKCRRCASVQGRSEITVSNVVPKVEPAESPLTDYSGDNTNDADISILEEPVEKKQTKSTGGAQKRRKKVEHDNNNKCKRCTPTIETDNVHKICSDNGKQSNVVLKIEPIESLLTDYSGENTNDTDIALLEDTTDKKRTASPETCTRQICLNERLDKIEVTSTQPCLNEKNNGNDNDEIIEIDKEVETVLQSGTRIESLSIKTESLNSVSSEAQNCKDPSFPCPFCPRVYNSWGYRRRHVKSRHVTNRLSCKWCVSVLPSTGAWYTHATRAHGVPHEEARNSLVVMVEAHAVLTLTEPNVTQLIV
ncbi:uncharacterized protein LOC142987235 [Anticarsia gemmatalis]|uniref:uncharacterized protein LOC142987235 n=1 Tax=Anticarsia gemmatalis TaxID=129554 RepID=UPI003F769E97